MKINELEARPSAYRMQKLPIPNLKELETYIRCDHVEIFWDAATRYNVFILVRRLNPKSMYYIGLPGYTPKNVDCKAKTAPGDCMHPEFGLKRTAGLVADPTVPGMGAAFGPRLEDAGKMWGKTKEFMAVDLSSVSTQRPFVVQTDELHEHFGCLMYSPSGMPADCKFIHGDYDLYGLVKAAKPRPNLPSDTASDLGTPIKYGPIYEGMREHLNRHFGTPMIQHGSQDTYTGFTDEKIDIFLPNGEVKVGVNETDTREFYRTWLNLRLPQGEETHHHGAQW